MKKFVFEIVMLVLGVLLFILSLPVSTSGFKGDVLNQRDYVLILCGLLIVASLGSIIYQLVRGRIRAEDGNADNEPSAALKSAGEKAEGAETDGSAEDQAKRNRNNRKIYISMALIALFAYGFSYIGFFVTSFLFVFIMTWMYSDWDRRAWLKSLLFSAALNLVLYFLFDLVHVYLPKAWLF